MNKTIIENIHKQQEGEHLGDLVGWSLSSVSVGQWKARYIAEQLGLEEDFKFPRLSAASAYRRAVKKAIAKGDYDQRSFVAVKLTDDTSQVVHAIVESKVVDNALSSGQLIKTNEGELVVKTDAKFNTTVKIGLNKEKMIAGNDLTDLLMTDDREHPVFKDVEAHYNNLVATYTADDIRTAFQRAFAQWNSMRILPSGGLWWVPAKHADKVKNWENFIKAIGAQAIVIPTFNTSSTVKSLKKAAETSLADKLKLLREQLSGFADKTRQSTMEKRLEEFSTLRKRAELYQQVLGVEINDLQTSVTIAENELTEIMLQKS